MRHILVAGGTGLVGRALVESLLAGGERVTIASRQPLPARGGAATCSYAALPADVGAVVNLAGANVVGKRWSPAYKQELVDSRVAFTQNLLAGLQRAGAKPAVWVNASAVGIYGDGGAERIDEDSPLASGFLPDLCRAWETAAATASVIGARVVILRIGIVLARDGGALAKMEPPFRWGLGGPIGRGRHYVPWIHRRDLVRLIEWALREPNVRGTYNASAPEPVTNLELSRGLAAALHRPCLFPAPPFALKLLFGEVGAHLAESSRAVPARALDQGFTFEFTKLGAALADLYGRTVAAPARA
jgi:uncharacterized protein (TIGR01777 family)